MESIQSSQTARQLAAAEPQVRLIRLREVLARTGASRSGLYAAIKSGAFPAPVMILPGGRAIAWPEAEIDDYLRARIALARRSGDPKK